MSSEIAIKVEHVSKCYRIFDKPRDRLRQLFATGGKKYYREFWALKDVSFEIQRGETVGIIGRNGAGKSTLLQLICGTLNLTMGSAKTHGRIAALLELGAGFNPEFTGRENVYMNAVLLGLSKREIDARFNDIVAFADIGDFIEQPVKRYSSGMYVRLAFAVIANVDADILIVDEALAVGDVLFAQKCMRFLQEFKKNGTILFVSHNSGAVVSLCDRAIWLDGGAIQAIGAAKQVCERYLAHRYQSPMRIRPSSPDKMIVAGSEDLGEHDQAVIVTKNDMRMDFINRSNLRNDIEVFDFDPDAHGFGSGGATIVSAQLTDMDGRQIAWVVGGEYVCIVIQAGINVACSSLIVGFQFKNRLGQVLFAQNTYLEYCADPVATDPDDHIEASFKFRMPILPRGSYSIDVAIADGVPPDVLQLHWMHDAIVLESHSSSVGSGLMGIMFDEIALTRNILNKTV